MLSKSILMARTIRIRNFKIQILAGNSLKSCLSAVSQISTTLVKQCRLNWQGFHRSSFHLHTTQLASIAFSYNFSASSSTEPCFKTSILNAPSRFENVCKIATLSWQPCKTWKIQCRYFFAIFLMSQRLRSPPPKIQ